MNILKCSIKDDIEFLIDSNLVKNRYSKHEHYLISKGLKDFYDINNFNIYYTENGKPYLDNDIYISISHDKDIVVIVLDTIPVGIDIQFYKEINPSFKEVLGIDVFDDRKAIDVFSKKEAILKLNGDVFSNINDYSIDNYLFDTIYEDNYVINCVYEK